MSQIISTESHDDTGGMDTGSMETGGMETGGMDTGSMDTGGMGVSHSEKQASSSNRSDSDPKTVPEINDAANASRRGRMGTAIGVKVMATGSYVPPNVVTNEDLAELGCDSEWIVRRTGILERRKAEPDQATSDLCYEAAIDCMRAANVSADQIDLIIVATITPDHPTPSTACHLQRRLGAVAPAMDVNAACAGFMYGMTTAAQFIAAGNSKCVLVVGADLMSRTVNPDDKKTYPLFGDGAGRCFDDCRQLRTLTKRDPFVSIG